ncbi:RNA polymerase I-specific transcription initiation factor RRN3-like [Quillaja saponaria]|uniref:RNA polymerase I-specific transcription initiation factor RRN3-like n=1 Tax=Quillaja saponaria TaxID=32244 RepID=A0AAD7Q1P9_QUISA|nr:RNA polymerase I-specific transcription initiation factor RRN3-like [Quillaja saponaria]
MFIRLTVLVASSTGNHVCALFPYEIIGVFSYAQIKASQYAHCTNLGWNSMKVCCRIVVEEFLRQAEAAHLFTTSDSFFSHAQLSRTNMPFPFDPLLHKNCVSFVRPHFIYWSMVRTTYDEASSNDEDVADVHIEDVSGDDMIHEIAVC